MDIERDAEQARTERYRGAPKRRRIARLLRYKVLTFIHNTKAAYTRTNYFDEILLALSNPFLGAPLEHAKLPNSVYLSAVSKPAIGLFSTVFQTTNRSVTGR
jgi:hypothetical protein